ncbi:MAG TPA: hypothetical protein VHR45_13350 [Thermoanaerobaculia bacterium]|nr:hypothetical protein [Thermoanaerobaculia bacterium]
MPGKLRRAAPGSAFPTLSALLALVALPALSALLAGPLRGQQAPFDPDLLAGLRARSIGPAGMSGRVTAIEGVERDPMTVYAGTASGGVWKSVSGGLTWDPIFDDQPVASIGALAVFQKSPEIVWVGTGEGNVRNSASVGNGVYRSLDGGKNWTHLGLDPSERIARIVLHPSDPNVAWVAALGREWGENPERGVFKTEDGGATWKKVLYVDEKTGAADLAIDPVNPQKLFAAMWQYRRWPWALKSGGPGSGLYVTYDGGRTWKRRSEDDGLPKGELGRINVAVSRSNPEIVYAQVEAKESALLRSNDGGRTWTSANKSVNIAPRPFYFAELKIDPQWPNRVYRLGFNVKVSDDSGKTFANLPADAHAHGDYHAMWIDPADPRHFLVGDDGGISVSRDRGRTEAFVANLPLAQYYHVALDMETPYNIYGGLQDNGSWRGPSALWQAGGIHNSAWTLVGDGDGFGTLPDPADSAAGYSMSQSGYLTRFDLRTGEFKDIRPAAPDGVKLRFNWNSGLAVDPFEPGTLYYGSQFLHKSTDRGKSWTIISHDLTSNNPAWQKQSESGGLTPDVSGAENYTTILAIAPSPVARDVIWVGTDDGRVQVTRDGGKNWTPVEGNVPGVPAHTWVPEIRASRFAAGTAFVVFDDHRRSNWTPYLFRTDDFGTSWKNLAARDVRGYALAVEQDPADQQLLFLGTEFGLWISNDGGGHWLRYKYGLPTAPVAGLAVHPRDHDLVIATHGRALYVLDDSRPLASATAATLSEPLHLFPIADAQQHWVKPGPGGFGLGAGEFRGENRPYGALITFSVAGPDIPLPDPEKERARKERERRAEEQAAAEKASAAPETTRPEGGEAAARAARGEAREAKESTAAKEPKEGKEAKEAKESKEAKQKAKEKEKEKGPKAEIRVADAAGKVIRHFKAPVKLGINRAAWGLERDDFKEPPPGPDQTPEEDPAGPEVPPGTYTVMVKFRNHEVKETVRVLADPRSKNGDADWQRRWETISRLGALQDAAVEAIERCARLRADVDAAVARAKEAKEKERKDPLVEVVSPLADAAEKLEKELDGLEKRLWVRLDAKGIQPQENLLAKIGYVGNAVNSQWDPPNPTYLEYLRQAGEQLDRFLADFNRFYATEVAAFRKQIADTKVGLLAEEPPLAVRN